MNATPRHHNATDMLEGMQHSVVEMPPELRDMHEWVAWRLGGCFVFGTAGCLLVGRALGRQQEGGQGRWRGRSTSGCDSSRCGLDRAAAAAAVWGMRPSMRCAPPAPAPQAPGDAAGAAGQDAGQWRLLLLLPAATAAAVCLHVPLLHLPVGLLLLLPALLVPLPVLPLSHRPAAAASRAWHTHPCDVSLLAGGPRPHAGGGAAAAGAAG